jgi:S-DNA-T family DNA segregation ATPase FtsK/SpoIIIE
MVALRHNAGMTFPLGSLRSDGAAPTKGSERRADNAGGARVNARLHRVLATPVAEPTEPIENTFRFQAGLLLSSVLWLLGLLALASHNRQDPAFTTSGQHIEPTNWVGYAGAYASDLAQFFFGHSAWWLLLIGARVLLGGLALWLRRDARASSSSAVIQPASARLGGRLAPWRLWLGLVLVMASSCALEWTRLYRHELALAGEHAGGILGMALGKLSSRWLGFNGSGVLWIALLIAGSSLALRFSWLELAERIGTLFEGARKKREAQREAAQDIRIGEKAAIERERVVEEVRHEQPSEPIPIIIEQPVVDVPKSERVVKEKQKPLFAEMGDNKLPQIDLLDASLGRIETVTSDTLEMTSRMIEKKLKDFGVEVRVVAASPGPVITRYEIEPATGVKGAQILNLAKDLARALSLVSIRVVETIPGKNLMALELPNAKRQMIRLTEILGSQIYHEAQSMLTIGLGKDIVGAPVVVDLAKMPHCLVAGTTGSGKSVGINATILSLLSKAEARDVRLI